MKITILQSIAGHAEPMYGLPEFSFRPGETVEVDAALGAAWVRGGIARKAGKEPVGQGAVPAVTVGAVTAAATSVTAGPAQEDDERDGAGGDAGGDRG